MSFLTRTTIFRAPIYAQRAFSTSFATRKSPADTLKDTVKVVDRKVSEKLVDGIELGETAAQKVKEGTGISSADEAKGKAAEVAGEAKGKAYELKGEAKGKVDEKL